ncbi:MAG: aminoacyl-tRNA hydrolase [Chloroflexi bacterium]|nr:aminoacyl-tRNA hydrolase [Chloroflexota bacterium]
MDKNQSGRIPPWLLVGLGNPGERYVRTRHNVGFRALDQLAAQYGISVSRKRFQALMGEGRLGNERVVMLKPQTFMNESGLAVQQALRWFKVPAERLLVIYDDIDLPIGRVRIRADGSSGGHRGIHSIIQSIGTQGFIRVRIGVSRPRGDAVDHVLSGFSADEEAIIREILSYIDPLVRLCLTEGTAAAMNRYNSLDLCPVPENPPDPSREG